MTNVNWTELKENQSNSSGDFSPRHTTQQLLRGTQMTLAENRIQPEQFEDRIISASIYNDNDWTKDGNKQLCVSKSLEVKTYARRFLEGHSSFLGPEKKQDSKTVRLPLVGDAKAISPACPM